MTWQDYDHFSAAAGKALFTFLNAVPKHHFLA